MDNSQTDIVPCGKCHLCLTKLSKQWSFRLQQEQKRSITSKFITLTYNDENLNYTTNGHETLSKRDLQLFLKRLRKKSKKITYTSLQVQHANISATPSLKYFACGEYGTKTKRPHYHMILFNLPQSMYNSNALEQIWGQGYVDIQPCNPGTMQYTTGYMLKGGRSPSNELDDWQPEFRTMSKKMGTNFLTPQMIKYLLNQEDYAITQKEGEKLAMPRYYKKLIPYTREDKKLKKEKSQQYHLEQIRLTHAECKADLGNAKQKSYEFHNRQKHKRQ